MELSKLKSNSQPNPDIFAEIGKIIVLPTDENPTIGTVTDVEKLRVNQPFFNSAKNGDKLIMYSKKAILYDPVAKKIIDVTLVNPSTVSAQTQSYKFYLLNGTTKIGLSQKYEAVLKKAIASSTVIGRDYAKKNNYAKTILVNINSSLSQKSSEISQALGIPQEELPKSEINPPGADFLIILGTDKENL